MQSLRIEAAGKTPLVDFNSDNGTLKISGISIPENSLSFFEPIFAWVDEYVKNPKRETTIIIQLEYFNTSSSKCLLDFFRKFVHIHESGKSSISGKWFYEENDEDIQEAGNDYKTIVKIPFVIEKIQK